MRKIVLFSIFILLLIGYLHAQTKEEINVTTYYPSPHANFYELECETISIGQLDPIPLDGVIRVESGILFTPQPEPLQPDPCEIKGRLVYGETSNEFHYCDGSSWKTF